MENKGSHSGPGPATNEFQSPDFSAVLQQIYQQAQTEIDARNRNLSSHFASAHFNQLQPPHYDDTFRFEPLVDPSLSFISNILAEDDEPTTNHPFLTSVQYNAYQAKASEMAALLNEDSPSLALKIEGGSPSSSVDVSSPPISVDPGFDANTFYLSYLEGDTPFSLDNVPEPSRNELLLNSLRGPVSQTIPDFLQVPSPEVRSPEILGDGQLIRPPEAGNHDEVSLKPHSHKLQKPEKIERVLKPRKESSSMRKKKGRASKDPDKECVELNDLLLQCSQAVGANNMKRAVEILNKVRQHASPYGNGAERLAYYFAEALEARFSGTGWQLYMGLLRPHPLAADILKATSLYMSSCPFVKASHYFITQTILNVARGASKVHILELQVDALLYPVLLKALADRPGGPPQVHLIGLGFPHYSMMPIQTDVVLASVQRTGRQLSDYAASLGVPFQFTAWAGVREDLCMQDFVSPYRKEGEVLVVISASLLRYVMDDTLDSLPLRSKLLKQGRDINPEVYIQGIVTGSYSTPFFTRRFREALFHFESVFDMLDTCIEREKADRVVFEGEILGKAILNIVACEGTEVVDRIDKYKHWQAVTEEVGFKQLPLDEEIKANVQLMLKTWHKEYTIAADSQYLLMGWKGRMLHAMSTWNAFPEDSS